MMPISEVKIPNYEYKNLMIVSFLLWKSPYLERWSLFWNGALIPMFYTWLYLTSVYSIQYALQIMNWERIRMVLM